MTCKCKRQKKKLKRSGRWTIHKFLKLCSLSTWPQLASDSLLYWGYCKSLWIRKHLLIEKCAHYVHELAEQLPTEQLRYIMTMYCCKTLFPFCNLFSLTVCHSCEDSSRGASGKHALWNKADFNYNKCFGEIFTFVYLFLGFILWYVMHAHYKRNNSDL